MNHIFWIYLSCSALLSFTCSIEVISLITRAKIATFTWKSEKKEKKRGNFDVFQSGDNPV